MSYEILQKLDDSNIRSEDLYSGDCVNGYLSGDMTKAQLRQELQRRRREMISAVQGIDKLLGILRECPKVAQEYGDTEI